MVNKHTVNFPPAPITGVWRLYAFPYLQFLSYAGRAMSHFGGLAALGTRGRGPSSAWEGLVRRNEVSFRPSGIVISINNLRLRCIMATVEVRFAHPSQACAWAPPVHEVTGDHASTVATITRLTEGNYSPASFRRSAFSAICSWSMHSWISPSMKPGRLYIDQLIR